MQGMKLRKLYQEAPEVVSFFLNTALYVVSVWVLYQILLLFPQY